MIIYYPSKNIFKNPAVRRKPSSNDNLAVRQGFRVKCIITN